LGQGKKVLGKVLKVFLKELLPSKRDLGTLTLGRNLDWGFLGGKERGIGARN